MQAATTRSKIWRRDLALSEAADLAVKPLQLFVQIGQNGGRKHIDPSQQVIRRDHLVQAKLVKELPLIPVLPPHHRRLSCLLLSRNHCSLGSSSLFDSIDP